MAKKTKVVDLRLEVVTQAGEWDVRYVTVVAYADEDNSIMTRLEQVKRFCARAGVTYMTGNAYSGWYMGHPSPGTEAGKVGDRAFMAFVTNGEAEAVKAVKREEKL